MCAGVADGLGMTVEDGGKGSEGSAVMSHGGVACVGSGGVSERNCCRLPGVIPKLFLFPILF